MMSGEDDGSREFKSSPLQQGGRRNREPRARRRGPSRDDPSALPLFPLIGSAAMSNNCSIRFVSRPFRRQCHLLRAGREAGGASTEQGNRRRDQKISVLETALCTAAQPAMNAHCRRERPPRRQDFWSCSAASLSYPPARFISGRAGSSGCRSRYRRSRLRFKAQFPIGAYGNSRQAACGALTKASSSIIVRITLNSHSNTI
jgi:hypothetical protein